MASVFKAKYKIIPLLDKCSADLLERIAHYLSKQDICNLRLSSSGFRNMDPLINQSDHRGMLGLFIEHHPFSLREIEVLNNPQLEDALKALALVAPKRHALLKNEAKQQQLILRNQYTPDELERRDKSFNTAQDIIQNVALNDRVCKILQHSDILESDKLILIDPNQIFEAIDRHGNRIIRTPLGWAIFIRAVTGQP